MHEIAIKTMLKSYIIYIQLSRCCEARRHSGKNCEHGLLITVDEFTPNLESPPMNLLTENDKRYQFCNIKTTNLLPAVLSSSRADNLGYDEVVYVKGETITECSKSNISIIKEGRIITHPKTEAILPGITREHLIKACIENQLTIIERPFTKEELFSADDILVTSSTKLLRTVKTIDGVKVGGKSHDVCLVLQNEINHDYYKYVKNE
jgi:D-alanine transaminase